MAVTGNYTLVNGTDLVKKEEVFTHTFSTGLTVELHPISIPDLIEFQRKRLPKPPKPPLQTFDRGDGVMVSDRNANDPEYLEAMQDYNLLVEEATRQFYILWAVDLSPEQIDKNLVERRRRMHREEYGTEMHPSDKVIFIEAQMVTQEDYEGLISLIKGELGPQEEGIAEVENSFRDPGEGETPVGDKSPEVWG